MPGPLTGVKVTEIAGIGPGPFCAMMLADMGAEVLRITRPVDPAAPPKADLLASRLRRRVPLDLKSDAGRTALLRIVEQTDVLIEGNRPGVMERLGLGPDVCLHRNPRLIYGRMTGWGQTGPLARTAGHDINYIALTGALAAIGPSEAPVPPLNLVGDFGGGAMMLAFGLACALFETRASGKGQVIDAAMTDGASLLMVNVFAQLNRGDWTQRRAANITDGGAPFYGTYRCRDGGWLAVGAIEPQFYALLLDKMGLEPAEFRPQHDRSRWPDWKARFAACFASRDRDDWCAIMAGTDACVTPVLDLHEIATHPHHLARNTFAPTPDGPLPGPAPRFSRTPPAVDSGPSPTAAEILAGLGFADAEIDGLCPDATGISA